MENVWRQYKTDFDKNPIVANIEGLGHFRNTVSSLYCYFLEALSKVVTETHLIECIYDQVIFAKMEGKANISRLTSLADKLREEFEAENIIGETRPFKPHMTVAKISRSKKLYRKVIFQHTMLMLL